MVRKKCDAEYILTSSGKCLTSGDNAGVECSDYIEAVKVGFCPKEYDVCSTDKSGKPYCHLKCNGEQVFCGDGCIDPNSSTKFCGAKGACSSTDSGSEDYAGAECAPKGFCQNGVCTSLALCDIDQHTNADGECVDNDVYACGPVDCTRNAGWRDGICNIDQCEATSCDDGYHLNKDVKTCYADISSCCGSDCVNCGDNAYLGGGGKVLETCKINQHNSILDGSCVDNTVEACGDVNCKDAPGWGDGICNINRCEASSCLAGFHFNKDTKACDADTAKCCGVECVDCGVDACINAQCKTVETCKRGEHNDPFTGECVDNTPNACGAEDCSLGLGWLDGICNIDKCEATSCIRGYHLNQDKACARIAMAPDGQFVVTWTDKASSDKTPQVRIRGFNADGLQAFEQRDVADKVAGTRVRPDVFMASNHDFVVAWEDDEDGNGGTQTTMRLFKADGTPKNSVQNVNTKADGSQNTPSISGKTDGSKFIVAWQNVNASKYAIMARTFDAEGRQIDADFKFSSESSTKFADPQVCMNDAGNAMAAWYTPATKSVVYRSFVGKSVSGSETAVNNPVNTASGTPKAYQPAIACVPGGSYAAIAFSDDRDGNSAFEIYAAGKAIK